MAGPEEPGISQAGVPVSAGVQQFFLNSLNPWRWLWISAALLNFATAALDEL